VDDGEDEADGQTGDPRGGVDAGDEQQHHHHQQRGQHDLDDQRPEQLDRLPPGVRAERARLVGDAARDDYQLQQPGRHDGPDDLGHHVEARLGRPDAAVQQDTERDRRVDDA
jgi:hypothetical protein